MSTALIHFVQGDVARLFRSVPYLAISKPERAVAFLRKAVEDGQQFRTQLADYPAILCEPLDHHYVCLQCLGALSEDLIEDLCRHYTWRGFIWACWLSSLSPSESFRRHIVGSPNAGPDNKWWIEFALAEIDGIQLERYRELHDLFAQLRTSLDGLPRSPALFRPAPDQKQTARLKTDKDLIARIYREEGPEAAQRYIKDSLWAEFL